MWSSFNFICVLYDLNSCKINSAVILTSTFLSTTNIWIAGIFTGNKLCRHCHKGTSIILHGGFARCVRQRDSGRNYRRFWENNFFLAVDQVSKMWARGRALSSCDKWNTGRFFSRIKRILILFSFSFPWATRTATF